MQNIDYVEYLEKLPDDYDDSYESEVVDFLAKSELPNTWFLQQFTENNVYPFYKKKYWVLFANVIMKRGIESIKEEDVLILVWFQDFNWPGLREIVVFIRENSAFFKDFFIKSMNEALITADIGWLKMLLLSLLIPDVSNQPIFKNIVSFAEMRLNNLPESEIKKFNKMVEKIYDEYRYPDNYKDEE